MVAAQPEGGPTPWWASAAAAVLVAITALSSATRALIRSPTRAARSPAWPSRCAARTRCLTFALVIAALAVFGATGQPGGPVYLTTFLSAVNLAVLRPMRTWLPWTAVAAVALVGAKWAGHGFTLHLIPVALLLLVAPKLAGDAVRARRLRVETLEARGAWPSRRRCAAWPRSACASRARSTTSSAMAWRRSRCAPASPTAWPTATRPRSARRCARSGR